MINEPAIRRGMAVTDGIEIAYEDLGDETAPPIVLIMGFSAQLTAWPLEFCRTLTDAGYRVIRFDNRDIGLSTKLSGHRVEGNRLLRVAQFWALGRPAAVPYTLHDMARDAVGVLDHLGIETAHVIGASMGGMIGQIVAAEYPDRVRTLGLVFTSTNEPFPRRRHRAASTASSAAPGQTPPAKRRSRSPSTSRAVSAAVSTAFPKPIFAFRRKRTTSAAITPREWSASSPR